MTYRIFKSKVRSTAGLFVKFGFIPDSKKKSIGRVRFCIKSNYFVEKCLESNIKRRQLVRGKHLVLYLKQKKQHILALLYIQSKTRSRALRVWRVKRQMIKRISKKYLVNPKTTKYIKQCIIDYNPETLQNLLKRNGKPQKFPKPILEPKIEPTVSKSMKLVVRKVKIINLDPDKMFTQVFNLLPSAIKVNKDTNIVVQKNPDVHLKSKRMKNAIAAIKTQCRICQKIFCSKLMLNQHMLTHLDRNRPFQCDLCSKGFNRKFELVHHMNLHLKQYSCSTCKETFTCAYNLNRHILIHQERKFKCNKCPKEFKGNENLKVHLNAHIAKNRGKFKCLKCSKKFSTQKFLDLHSFTHSDLRPERCMHCPKQFKNTFELNKHLRGHSELRPFKCDDCPAAFKQYAGLYTHRYMHDVIPKYKCEICNREFKHQKGLFTHMATHSDNRPFKCDQCENAYKLGHHLKSHKDSVHNNGVRPFQCSLCPATFRLQYLLGRHQVVHTGELRHKCQHCKIPPFKYGKTLNQHIRDFHPETLKFVCSVCSLRFLNKKTLERHGKNHKGK